MYAMMKATDHCNMGCKYCYVPQDQRKSAGRLSTDVMPTLFRKMFDWQQNEAAHEALEMCWSGGEVLTLPLDWWRQMLDIQERVYGEGQYEFHLKNSMQTNLTLMDDERFEFFEAHHVGIGTSMDGPKHVMDQTRILADGRSAFDVMIEKLTRLKKKYGKMPGAIMVLSRANVDHLEEVVRFFNELGVGLQINPYHYTAAASDRHDSLAIGTREQVDAMCRLFDRWSDSSDGINISNTYRWTDFLLYGKQSVCNMNPACASRFYMVRWNGDVYPCNEFSGAEFEKPFCYGNLLQQDWREIRDHPTRQLLLDRHKLVKACKEKNNRCSDCRYWEGCFGGCLHRTLQYQYRTNGDCSVEFVASHRDTENCEVNRAIFSHVEKKLREASQSHLLPVRFYPDRHGGDRKEFYDYHRRMWNASHLDPRMVPPRSLEPRLDHFRPYVHAATSVLHICCGSESFLDHMVNGNGWKTETLGVDYRWTDEQVPARTTVETCDDLFQWPGWRSDRKWDLILIPLPYIHPEDTAMLLRQCHDRLNEGGRIVVYAPRAYLNGRDLVDVADDPAVREHDPGAVGIMVGELSHAVLY